MKRIYVLGGLGVPKLEPVVRCNSLPWMFLLLAVGLGASAQELHPGVWGGRDLSVFPIPLAGYDVSMIGELHGVKENVAVLMQYAAKLYEVAGLREIALEEKPAYETDAQAYVDGESDTAPPPLCLRAEVLQAIRRFNEGRKHGERLRVRLVDIDINPEAIREHLLRLKKRIHGADVWRRPQSR